MNEIPLPSSHHVRLLLSDLVGKDVDIAHGSTSVRPDAGAGALVGIYVDDRNRLAAVVMFDFALTAYAGAAIGLIPPGGANAALEDGELPESIVENAGEILNVMASLFNNEDVHLRLERYLEPGFPVPADVAGQILGYGPRASHAVTVKGYGTGHVEILTAQ